VRSQKKGIAYVLNYRTECGNEETLGVFLSYKGAIRHMSRHLRAAGVTPESIDLPCNVSHADYVDHYFESGDGGEAFFVTEHRVRK